MAGVRTFVLAALALVLSALGVVDGAMAEGTAKWPGQCVADSATMRRNHFEMLLHQRDDTMHRGERPSDRSLGACLDCHAVKGADGHAVTAADSRHFCRTCHDSAAVRIDCFSCHNSAPGASK
ncbi:MAG TPA: cytochrome c3 family protein [Azospirillum sp.]|nr:cytochrome c3 family protein [Azospirillum sp.]